MTQPAMAKLKVKVRRSPLAFRLRSGRRRQPDSLAVGLPRRAPRLLRPRGRRRPPLPAVRVLQRALLAILLPLRLHLCRRHHEHAHQDVSARERNRYVQGLQMAVKVLESILASPRSEFPSVYAAHEVGKLFSLSKAPAAVRPTRSFPLPVRPSLSIASVP